MSLHSGENVVNGVPVVVERKRVRRIGIRIKSDGIVRLTVPKWWATLREGEEFLLSKWDWVLKARKRATSRKEAELVPITAEMLTRLGDMLGELTSSWAIRLSESGVTWKLRQMKTQWGSCHFFKRHITYNTELARAPRELVEYVVVHELTHLKAHDHGPEFHRLMSERLPDWKTLRNRLNHREFGQSPVLPAKPLQLVQGELFDCSLF